jgi:hypothetical protein
MFRRNLLIRSHLPRVPVAVLVGFLVSVGFLGARDKATTTNRATLKQRSGHTVVHSNYYFQ